MESRSSATDTPQNWELAVMLGGAVMLLGSFLPLVTLEAGAIDRSVGEMSWNAWSNTLNLFPVATLAVAYGAIAAGQLALTRFANSSFPDRVAGITWSDVRLLAGTLAVLTMAGYFLMDFDDEVERGTGLYLTSLGAISLLVGAVMERRSKGVVFQSSDAVPRRQPNPGEVAILGAGAAILFGSFLTVRSFEGADSSAWGESLFPLYTVPALLGAVMALQVAFSALGTMKVPSKILGLEWGQIHRAFGVHAALMMLGFLVGNVYFSVFGQQAPEPGYETGFWIMLIGSLGLAAGAIRRDHETAFGGDGAAGVPSSQVVGSESETPMAPPTADDRMDFAPPPAGDRIGSSPSTETPTVAAPVQAPTVPDASYCGSCGAELQAGARFCASCGRKAEDQ